MEDVTYHQAGDGYSTDDLVELVGSVGLVPGVSYCRLVIGLLQQSFFSYLLGSPFSPFSASMSNSLPHSFFHPASSSVSNPSIDIISIFTALIKTRLLVNLISFSSYSHWCRSTRLDERVCFHSNFLLYICAVRRLPDASLLETLAKVHCRSELHTINKYS